MTMGQIRIETWGSFPTRRKEFSAMSHGHAHAVAVAIQFLSTSVLPEAIERDHRLHQDGHLPPGGSFDAPVAPIATKSPLISSPATTQGADGVMFHASADAPPSDETAI